MTTRSKARSRPRSASSRSWRSCEFPPRPRRPARRPINPWRRRWLYDNEITGTFPVALCDVDYCCAYGNNLFAPRGTPGCCDLSEALRESDAAAAAGLAALAAALAGVVMLA